MHLLGKSLSGAACLGGLLLLLLTGPSEAIFEDKKGLNDWHLAKVGAPKHVEFLRKSTLLSDQFADSVVVATERDVLARLNVTDGSIIWRREMLGPIHGMVQVDGEVVTLVGTHGKDGARLGIWGSEGGDLLNEEIILGYVGAELSRVGAGGDVLVRGSRQVERWDVGKRRRSWSWTLEGEGSIERTVLVSGQKVVYAVGPTTAEPPADSPTPWRVQGINAEDGTAAGAEVIVKGVYGRPAIAAGEGEATLLWVDGALNVVHQTLGKAAYPRSEPLSKTFRMLVEDRVEEVRLVEVEGREATILLRASIAQDTHAHYFAVGDGAMTFITHLRLEARDHTPPVVGAVSHHLGVQYLVRARKWEESVDEASVGLLEVMDVKEKMVGRAQVPWDFSTHGTGHFSRVWVEVTEVMAEAGKRPIVRLLLLGEDGGVVLVERGEKVWRREEGMAGVVGARIVELPEARRAPEEIEAKEVEEAEEAEEANSDPKSLSFAWKQYNARWGAHSLLFGEKIHALLSSLPGGAGDSILSFVSAPAIPDALVRDRFGMRKVAVLLGANGKVFALDTGKGGRLVWSRWFGDAGMEGEGVSVEEVRPLGLETAPLVAVTVRTVNTTVVHTLDALTGASVGEGATYPFRVARVMALQVSSGGPEGVRPLALYTPEHMVHLYPRGWSGEREVLEGLLPSLHPLSPARAGDVRVAGMRIIGAEVEAESIYAMDTAWSLEFPEGEVLVTERMRPEHDPVASLGRILGDRSVLYKYLNPNLLSLLTFKGDEGGDGSYGRLSLYLLDGITGRILGRREHEGVGRPAQLGGLYPVHLVLSENWAVYAYYSGGQEVAGGPEAGTSKGYTITVVEMFKKEEEEGEEGMEKGKRERKSSPTFNPFTEEEPTFLGRSYQFPQTVRWAGVTKTRQGITTRKVLLGLGSNQVYGVSRRLLDGRAWVEEGEKEEGLVKYEPFLPVDPRGVLSYDVTVLGMRGVETAASLMESTSLLLVYGDLDVFWTQESPSGTFDMLSDDFSKEMLLTTIFGLSAAILLSGPWVKRKMLGSRWV